MITWEKEGNVYRMRMPITQVELEDRRQGFSPVKGLLFGILFSSPFWAFFIWMCWLR